MKLEQQEKRKKGLSNFFSHDSKNAQIRTPQKNEIYHQNHSIDPFDPK